MDGLVIKDETPTGGKIERIDYAISTDMSKRLAMKSESVKADEIRTYFIECERKLKESFNSPQVVNSQFAALIKSLEALDRVEQEQLRLKAQTEAQAATIFNHDNRLDVIEAKQDAKLLGCQYFAIMGHAKFA